jgi:transcription initiation factor TFIIIB Brf1 subunit/transcription initiation factor TFIIB
MSAGLGGNRARDVCSHHNTVDTAEGDNVCTDCGKVVGQIYAAAFSEQQQQRRFISPDQLMYEYIRDVGENACIAGCVVKYAEGFYSKVKKELLPRFTPKTIATYALYEALNTFEVPRMAQEIEYFTGVKIRDIWRIESTLVTEDRFSDPAQHVLHYCIILNFTYPEQMFIQKTVDVMQEQLPLGALRSNCISAVVIYLYCKDVEKKITLRKICEKCEVSATSVHRVIRLLKQHSSAIRSSIILHWMFEHICKNK